MNQLTLYREAKERHPGMLLMFRVGGWYEIVGDDAETCVRLLGLTLAVNAPDGTLIVRFAHQWLESYLRKLLHAGHRVAICDQIEPATLPNRVEVSRIVTGGCRAKFEKTSPEDPPDPASWVQPSFLPGDPGDLECGRQRMLFDLGEKMAKPERKRADQRELF